MGSDGFPCRPDHFDAEGGSSQGVAAEIDAKTKQSTQDDEPESSLVTVTVAGDKISPEPL